MIVHPMNDYGSQLLTFPTITVFFQLSYVLLSDVMYCCFAVLLNSGMSTCWKIRERWETKS